MARWVPAAGLPASCMDPQMGLAVMRGMSALAKKLHAKKNMSKYVLEKVFLARICVHVYHIHICCSQKKESGIPGKAHAFRKKSLGNSEVFPIP